jgi:predicted MFS family arabinose efflux permease
MTGYGVGSLLGTLIAVPIVTRTPVLSTARVSWTVAGGAWVMMGAWPATPVVTATAALAGSFAVVGITAVNAAITRSSSGAERRTLLSGQTVVVSAASSAGMLVGGTVIAALGVQATLLVAGLLVSAVALAVPVLLPRLSARDGAQECGSLPTRASPAKFAAAHSVSRRASDVT